MQRSGCPVSHRCSLVRDLRSGLPDRFASLCTPILYFLLCEIGERGKVRIARIVSVPRFGIFVVEAHIGLRAMLRGRGPQQSHQSHPDEQRCYGRPVKEPPGQSGTNRQCGSGIGSNSLRQLRQHALRTIFGSFFGLLDQLVFGFASLRPQFILEAREIYRRTQPSQIIGKPGSGLFDVPLERVKVGLAHRLPRPGSKPARPGSELRLASGGFP